MRYERQTSKLTRSLTGMHHSEALQLARTNATDRRNPVPDAHSAHQRAFETRLTFALIDAFPESHQPPETPWGIATVHPDSTGLDIFPAPDTTEAVLDALLPYHDREYGGIRGASGTRVTATDNGWWILRDLNTDAQVRVAAHASVVLPRLPHGTATRSRPLITSARLTREERHDLSYYYRLKRHGAEGWFDHLNILGSRLLRRPGLLSKIAKFHGNANIYSHGSRDVVLEWCCGPTSNDIALACRKAGMTADLAGQTLPGSAVELRTDVTATIHVGRAKLYLHHNRGICSGSGPEDS